MKFLATVLAFTVLCASFGSDAEAGRKRKRKRGARCGSVPSALYGGQAAQERHNRAADADDLTRLESRSDLERFIEQGWLVPIGSTRSYYLDTIGGHDAGHAELYRHARPWTKKFLDRELKTLRAKFGHRSKVTSLVRTDAYQGRICRSGNAAAICGGDWWEQSLHITGAAVDISKERMSCKAKKWMRSRLVTLQKQGLVGAIEERGAFHVFVRKAYGKDAAKPKKAKKAKKAKRKKKARKRRRTR
jgi:uncharacterized protein DUF5715